MTQSGVPLARRRGRAPRLVVVLAAALAIASTAIAPAGAETIVPPPPVQPPYWGATCGNVPNPDRAGFTTHQELGERLRRIARSSGGSFFGNGPAPDNLPPGHGGTPPGHAKPDPIARRVIVDVPGRSVRGREIYRARVGLGDTVVLLVGNIHGNEKHGMEALQNILHTLGTSRSPAAKRVRRELTVVAIPMLNPDGSTLDRRHNDQPWTLVERMYPQLRGANPPWYYTPSAGGGFDLNRDFNPNLDYEPTPETLPPADGNPGSYLGTESRTVRAVYRALRAEFGHVDLLVDLHNQGPCVRDRTAPGDPVSFLSIAGWLGPDYPASVPAGVDADLTRKANVAVYDALQIPDTQWRFVTRFATSLGRPGAMLGATGLHGTATVLMETSGQTQHIGTQFKEFLVTGNEIALGGLLNAFADDSVRDLNPNRYDTIPLGR